jgi:Cu+-exporting ATPase
MSCCCNGDAGVGIGRGRNRSEGATAELSVRGMSCGSCARRIEKTVAKLGGVRDASVDLEAARATFTYDPSLVTLADIESAIRELGYETSR